MDVEQKRSKLVGGNINQGGRKILFLPQMNPSLINGDDSDDDYQVIQQSAVDQILVKTNEVLYKKDENKDELSNRIQSNIQKFFAKASKDCEEEIVLLSEVQRLAKKIYYHEKVGQNQIFPAFTLITNEEKGKINKKRFILKSMLQPFCRKQAKKQLVSLAKLINFSAFIEDFENNESERCCFWWYSLSCFYHYTLNKGLKAFKSPEECFYLRLIYKDIFLSILEKYQYQVHEQFTCWRNTFLMQSQIQKLKKNIHEFIQLQGFISTSKEKTVATNFDGNVLFQILVPKKQGPGSDTVLQYGYADISEKAIYKEFQILFNCINYFQILNVTRVHSSQYQWHIKLRYCRISDIQAKVKKTKKQEQLLNNYIYQQMKAQKIRNQGDCFFECQQYTRCLDWYTLRIIQIKKQFRNKFSGQITSSQLIDTNLEKKKLYKEYFHALFIQTSCLNNLKQYPQALKKILQTYDFYENHIKQKNQNFYFLSKAKGMIMLNCGQEEKGLGNLKKLIKEIDKIKWKDKKKSDDFKDEIIRTLNYWKGCYNVKLDEEIEMKLKAIQKTRGRRNSFYLTTLKNKFIVLYDKGKWKEILNQFDEILKFEKQAKQSGQSTILTKKDFFFYVYVSCLSQLQMQKTQKAQKIFKKFIENFQNQNDESSQISCHEASMFLHLVSTFYQKEKKEHYLNYLNAFLQYESCFAEDKAEQIDFNFRKKILMEILEVKSPILRQKMENFQVLNQFNEVL